MTFAMLLPMLFRKVDGTSSRPSYLNKQISPILQSLSRRACTHPIHTIVFVALLASTTYIGLLEGSLFEATSSPKDASARLEFDSLVESGRRLRLSPETGWKWQVETSSQGEVDSVGSTAMRRYTILTLHQAFEHVALITLVFPKSLSNNSPQTAPLANAVPVPNNTFARSLPSTSNPFSPISQDTTLAFAVPFEEAPAFLDGIHEIPEYTSLSQVHHEEGRKWVFKAARSGGNGSQNTLRNWATNAWTGFVDLLKVDNANSNWSFD